MIKLQSVMQGGADVMSDGIYIGHVCHSYTDGFFERGWYAYDSRGLRISQYPNCKRSHAINEVVAHNAALRQAA